MRNLLGLSPANVPLLVLVLLLLSCTGPAGTPAPTTQLQWLGQSTFLLTSSQGSIVLVDPPSSGTGYAISPISGVDAVLVTHEHSDHNNVGLAMGNPLVLRGLTTTGWNTIDQRVKDIRIYSVSPAQPIYHDSQQGAQRGRNTIFVLEVDGLRLPWSCPFPV